MEELRLWAPSVIALAMLAWNVTLFRLAARKEQLAKLEDRIIEAEAKFEGKAGRAWVEGLQGQVQAQEARVQKLEIETGHMPTNSQFHELALGVQTIKGDLNVIAATLKTNTEITRRVQDFLMEQKP